MSRDLMVVEQPELFEQPGLDPSMALCSVYRCYGFRLPDEIPAAGQTLIVAAQIGAAEPQPISRDDFFANALDPVRGKAEGGQTKGMNLRSFTRRDNILVFVFDA
jgi:hypothetical protein